MQLNNKELLKARSLFGGKPGGSGGGADWNANEGEAGYVKNRTHYTAKEEVTLFEGSVQDTEGWGVELIGAPKFVVGQEYTVVLDGATYKCEANEEYDIGAPYLGEDDGGNLNFDYSIYPFSINGYEGVYANFADKNEHSLKLTTVEEVNHKLDEKYLPFGEFKILQITIGPSFDYILCNLPFEEAFEWCEKNMAIGLAIHGSYYGFFYLIQAIAFTKSEDNRYIEMHFAQIHSDQTFKLWYLSDGTITRTDPTA
jgi:hypothetical protein